VTALALSHDTQVLIAEQFEINMENVVTMVAEVLHGVPLSVDVTTYDERGTVVDTYVLL
jgi:hypothetical protein